MFTEEIRQLVGHSVLSWLATCDDDGVPNVSPKEVYTLYGDEFIFIANIASPTSAQNIKLNPNVAVSMVDIWTQQGYQMKGKATLLNPGDDTYQEARQSLEQITQGKFPFEVIFSVKVEKIKTIKAPSYYVLGNQVSDCIQDSEQSYLSILQKQKENQE